MAGEGKAFAKGGFGCLLAFFALGLVCLLIGGSVRIDLCGAALLFGIGGIIGLVIFAVYNKGVREGRQTHDKFPGDDKHPDDGIYFDQEKYYGQDKNLDNGRHFGDNRYSNDGRFYDDDKSK